MKKHPRHRKTPALDMPAGGVGLVAIGASTGGPKALEQLIPKLPKRFPVPVVIALHMPAAFTGPYAERLNELSQVTVKEAEEGDRLEPGVVYVAPGRGHLRIKQWGGRNILSILPSDKSIYIFQPSVNVLMYSVSECFHRQALGIILTGMGEDGLQGFKSLKGAGGMVFAQDEGSCAVYGMPKAVVDAGLADKVMALEDMAEEILNLF